MYFEDAFEMINAILGYVKEYPGRVIVSADVPQDLTYGFTLRDKDPFLLDRPTWRIKVRDFRDSIAKRESSERLKEVLHEYFMTMHGRARMAQLLSRGFDPVASV
jgi:hypothetical protein